MAANPKPPAVTSTSDGQEPYHIYHAEAHILSGTLENPINQTIEHYGHAILQNTRRESHIAHSVAQTSVEGLISFTHGHTRVIGRQVKQKTDILGNDHAGWVTLSTAVIEGFNVLDIITADRVVAQVSTSHANDLDSGRVPSVTFLGTRFENLRIGGQPVEVELDLGVCGDKPEGGRSFLQDIKGFLDRVQRHYDSVRSAKGLPENLRGTYHNNVANIDDLRQRAKNGTKLDPKKHHKVPCTLVKKIGEIPIPGVEVFGNAIFIPNFGTVSLAEVEVGVRPADDNLPGKRASNGNEPSASNYFTVNMFSMNLGCPTVGTVNGPTAMANGQNGPGKNG